MATRKAKVETAEIELRPDGWNRFERAVDAAVAIGPIHRSAERSVKASINDAAVMVFVAPPASGQFLARVLKSRLTIRTGGISILALRAEWLRKQGLVDDPEEPA